MNRRDFLKKIGLLFCSIPFLGSLPKRRDGFYDKDGYWWNKVGSVSTPSHQRDFRRLQDYPGTKVLMQYSYSGDYWWI